MTPELLVSICEGTDPAVDRPLALGCIDRIAEIVLTGDLFPIERLHEYGFTNYIEDTPDAVRARARDLATRIAKGAPLSVIAAKASVRATMDLGCAGGLEEGKRLHEVVYASNDAIEGPKAFAEKREPVWTGT